MTLIVSVASAIVALDALTALVNVNAPGLLTIYDDTGAEPADLSVAITSQVTLAELPMSGTAFGGATDDTPGAIAAANAITDDSVANATGTAAFFRIADGNGLAVIQGTVGTSGQELNLNSIAITAGAKVSISSLTITQPEQ